MRAQPELDLYRAANRPGLPICVSVQGAGRERTQIVRGFLGCDAESSTPRPGSDGLLSSLSELLLVEVIRFFSNDRLAMSWTLSALAKEVGASRSVLADRFAQLLGVPPMQDLARWRMQLAANLLRTTTANLAEVAERVGYGQAEHKRKLFLDVHDLGPGKVNAAAAAQARRKDRAVEAKRGVHLRRGAPRANRNRRQAMHPSERYRGPREARD